MTAYTLPAVDMGAIPSVNRLEMLNLARLWTETRPHLARWWDRVKARPNFAPALLNYLPPGIASMMRKKGEEAWPKMRDLLGMNGRYDVSFWHKPAVPHLD